MKISNSITNTYRPQFGAIFKFRNDGSKMASDIKRTVAMYTNEAEAQKLENKYELGCGDLYIYIPNSQLDKLKNCLNTDYKSHQYNEYLERMD